MITPKHVIAWVTNATLAVLYLLGGAQYIAPSNTIIPSYFGALSLGTLLIMVGLSGSPYYIEKENPP